MTPFKGRSKGERLKEFVLTRFPQLSEIVEQPINELNNSNIIGWHSSFIGKSQVPLSGGTAAKRNDARRIALAEALERLAADSLVRSDLSASFFLPEFPTTCGFAAGFSGTRTLFRSICEAVERWAWSQWIDYSRNCPEMKVDESQLTPLARKMLFGFDRALFFKQRVILPESPLGVLALEFGVVLGIKNDGIFVGSRVSSPGDDLWTHSSVELNRNLNNFSLVSSGDLSIGNLRNDFFFSRLIYFGNRASAALAIVQSPKANDWPIPKLILCAQVPDTSDHFVWRSLCDGYKGWHEGDETRFVY